jgi:hypothetical protein
MSTRIDQPFDYKLNDVVLVGDFVDSIDIPYPEARKDFNLKSGTFGYVCIANDANMKKKRIAVKRGQKYIHVCFYTIDGTPMIPSAWLFDGLLLWR